MHSVETMAYANETPWHGLGNKLPPGQPIEVWADRAGMDWRIEESPVRYVASGESGDSVGSFPENRVLYRSDTKAPLSVVSNRFQVVQPAEVLDFFREITEAGSFELETAGVLRAGRKFWALAKTGQSVCLKGRDKVHGYLLLATACDGSMATTATHTSIRVCCSNSLAIALREGEGVVKVPHRSQFDPMVLRRTLGINISAWDGFVARMKALAECKVKDDAVEGFLRRVLTYPVNNIEGVSTAINDSALKVVHELYAGRGKGSEMTSAAGTAWGLVNAISEFTDHYRRARSDDHRRDAAWFGQGAAIKQKAWEEALKLLA